MTLRTRVLRAGTPVSYEAIVNWGGQPEADVFWGGEPALFGELGRAEAPRPARPPAAPLGLGPGLHRVAPADPAQGPSRLWVGTGLEIYGIAYSPRLLKQLGVADLHDWDDLLQPKLKGQIVQCMPTRSSSSHATYQVILQIKGEASGWEWLKRLGGQTARFVTSSREVPAVVARTELAVGFGVPSYYAFEEKLAGFDIRFVAPQSAFVTPEPYAVLAGAKHPRAARQFAAFLLSERGQRLFMGRGLVPGEPAVQGARAAGVDGRAGRPADRGHAVLLRPADVEHLRRRPRAHALPRGEREVPAGHRGGMGRPQEAVLEGSGGPTSQRAPARRRGRLLWHYFLISFVLLAGGLVTSGLWEIYFRYQEIQENIASAQRDAASDAALRLDQFIQEIHRSLVAATRSREVTARGLSPNYQLRAGTAPAHRARRHRGRRGRTPAASRQAGAARLRTVYPEGKRDFSTSKAFQAARRGESYFGPAYFVRDTEPYMTMAVPIEHLAGDVVGVLLAEVSLIYVSEHVVARLADGKSVYVVNRAGDLLAHPQVNLVLQRTNVAHLDQVRGALAAAAAGASPKGTLTRSSRGERVFSSFAAIPGLDWLVFVERPAEEVYRPLYASIQRTATLLLVGLGMTLLASLLVARRILRPLQTLRQGVERIGSGDLGFRLDGPDRRRT